MSTINSVIDKIAILAEQSGYIGCLEDWSVCGSYNPDYPPRLSFEQIQELTQNYPFNLPLELCELYQRGNSCLPIGVNHNKNWDSFDSYFPFQFPLEDDVFFPLGEAINTYCSIASWLKKNEHKLQLSGKTNDCQQKILVSLLNNNNFSSRLFPISSPENGLYVVVGNEKQQETSPILFLWEDLVISMEWPSLTCMMLGMAEVMERKMQSPKPNGYEIEAIWHKYAVADASVFPT
ncbi:hypothetical protein [Nostoc sp. ChiSLP03a]|uniref:hypothetical protein n=1 Tax=Nostoc sp. ChiSLP03a TaxID=3075380 RepID=UPI002AD55FC3|nr:hypothetical protein [Nostoc sp. ChiSLP03a]MDZ8215098.1 hypothetical protein [Nostoc sp. ChiSLP03a]